jgi:hypothetical protein
MARAIARVIFTFSKCVTVSGRNTAMLDLTSDINENIEKIASKIRRLKREAKSSVTNPPRLREIASELGQLEARRSLLRENLQTVAATLTE